MANQLGIDSEPCPCDHAQLCARRSMRIWLAAGIIHREVFRVAVKDTGKALARTTALPYTLNVQTVIETIAFLADAEDAGMSEEEREALVAIVAKTPTAGDLMKGTGGCRKLRFKKPGTGKSGGYRVITYFGGSKIPVFLLTVFGKNQRANLNQAERNALAKLTGQLKDTLRRNEESIRQDRRGTE